MGPQSCPHLCPSVCPAHSVRSPVGAHWAGPLCLLTGLGFFTSSHPFSWDFCPQVGKASRGDPQSAAWPHSFLSGPLVAGVWKEVLKQKGHKRMEGCLQKGGRPDLGRKLGNLLWLKASQIEEVWERKLLRKHRGCCLCAQGLPCVCIR